MSKKTRATGFYNSGAWKQTRRNYKQSVGGLCERCLAKGIITPAEVVHHKVELTPDNIKDLNLSLGWDNLQALCRQCHAEVHSGMEKRYTLDAQGKVVISDTVY